MNKTNKHIHADVIKAWADGAEIEYRKDDFDCWMSTINPQWLCDYQYRVKPEAPEFGFWKPEVGEDYWTLDSGEGGMYAIKLSYKEELHKDIEFGNCFRTLEEATEALSRVKIALHNDIVSAFDYKQLEKLCASLEYQLSDKNEDIEEAYRSGLNRLGWVKFDYDNPATYPSDHRDVLVYGRVESNRAPYTIDRGYFGGGEFHEASTNDMIFDVIYWSELPEAPGVANEK